MVRIGVVGIGFMGWAHFSGANNISPAGKLEGSKLNGGEITAICTRSAEKLAGDWTSIQGNFGPRGQQLDLADISAYDDYREMFRDPEIDLIDICLPNDKHEDIAIAALNAGKHVLVEKPIAVDVAAAERMLAAAEKAGRLLMVAQVLPFFPEFQFVHQAISQKTYGELQAAHFRRVISAPKWGEMEDFRKLGGWGIDLHIHDNHFISLLCGTPSAVFSRGLLQDGLVNHVHTQYVFDDSPVAVTAVSGGIAAEGLAFAHGFELYCERGTLLLSAGTLGGQWCVDRPLTVIADGQLTQPTLTAGDWCAGFTQELQTAVNAVHAGQAPRLLSGTLACDALRVCVAEAKSIQSGTLTRVRG